MNKLQQNAVWIIVLLSTGPMIASIISNADTNPIFYAIYIVLLALVVATTTKK